VGLLGKSSGGGTSNYNPASVAITGGTITGVTSITAATINATTEFQGPRWESANAVQFITMSTDITIQNGGSGRAWINKVDQTYFGGGTGNATGAVINGTFGWTNSAVAQGVAADVGFSRLGAASLALGNGTTGSFAADLKLRNLITTGAAASAGASTVAFGGTTQTTIGANGGASALTALPLGYITVNVAGTAAIIPYYNA
jgi:hypothetical protein